MPILLAKDDPMVCDFFACQLYVVCIAGAHYALHFGSSLQLLPIAFTERRQVSNGNRINPTSLKLLSDCYRKILIQIEAKLARCQRVCP